MSQKLILSLLAMTIGAALAGAASAADICQGSPPTKGAVIHGPVLEVPDASSLCIATGVSPAAWVKVSLPQMRTTHSALMAAAFGKNATCTVAPDGRDDCAIEGQPLAMALHNPEIVKTAYAWR